MVNYEYGERDTEEYNTFLDGLNGTEHNYITHKLGLEFKPFWFD